MHLHIMAIGVHPDDVELGCSGTLINHIRKGQQAGILDLTRGELGSRGSVEIRHKEATEAAQVAGVSIRHNLGMADGFFENDTENRLKIITYLRRYQPEIVLANALDDRHPDHGRAGQLIRDACFLSGLRKISTQWEGEEQAAWRPKRVFHYIQDRFREPDIIVDISSSFPAKMEAIRCFGTQFLPQGSSEPQTYISRSGFLEKIEGRALELGQRIGVTYGEGFNTSYNLGIRDMDALILPEFP